MYLKLCWTTTTDASDHTKCISSFFDQNALMPARTQNVSQLALIKRIPWLWVHKLHRNICILNPSNASDYINCKSAYVDQAYPTPARIKNCNSIPVDQNFTMLERKQIISQLVLNMPANTQNASQLVLTKTLWCQRGQKRQLNMCWTNPSHASEDTNCFSTCVDQTHTKQVGTQNVSQHVFTKPLAWQRRFKM